MKRILTTLCALALFAVGVTPALAAEASLPSCYYPISVEEYTYGPLDEPRINKVYQLSLSNDPSLIPTGDFERGGRRFYLLDLIRQAEVGVDIQPCTETVKLASDTNKMDDTPSGTARPHGSSAHFWRATTFPARPSCPFAPPAAALTVTVPSGPWFLTPTG